MVCCCFQIDKEKQHLLCEWAPEENLEENGKELNQQESLLEEHVFLALACPIPPYPHRLVTSGEDFWLESRARSPNNKTEVKQEKFLMRAQ